LLNLFYAIFLARFVDFESLQP